MSLALSPQCSAQWSKEAEPKIPDGKTNQCSGKGYASGAAKVVEGIPNNRHQADHVAKFVNRFPKLGKNTFRFHANSKRICLTSRAQARGTKQREPRSGTGTAIPRCLQRFVRWMVLHFWQLWRGGDTRLNMSAQKLTKQGQPTGNTPSR